jgi:hypothetical protein
MLDTTYPGGKNGVVSAGKTADRTATNGDIAGPIASFNDGRAHRHLERLRQR